METLLVRNPQEAIQACKRLISREAIGCDIETSHLSPKVGKIWCIQLSDGEFTAIFPFDENAYNLRDLFESPKIKKVFHNAKFDLAFLHRFGFGVANLHCTMIAEKLITRGADQSVSLAETLYRYFGIWLDKSQRQIFTKDWDGVWTEQIIQYAVNDVVYLPKLAYEQMIWLRRLGLEADFLSQMESLSEEFR